MTTPKLGDASSLIIPSRGPSLGHRNPRRCHRSRGETGARGGVASCEFNPQLAAAARNLPWRSEFQEKAGNPGANPRELFGVYQPKTSPCSHIYILFFFFWCTKRPEMFGFSLFFGDVILGLSRLCQLLPAIPQDRNKRDLGLREEREEEIGCGFKGAALPPQKGGTRSELKERREKEE